MKTTSRDEKLTFLLLIGWTQTYWRVVENFLACANRGLLVFKNVDLEAANKDKLMLRAPREYTPDVTEGVIMADLYFSLDRAYEFEVRRNSCQQ